MARCIHIDGNTRCPADALPNRWYCQVHTPHTIEESVGLLALFLAYHLTRPNFLTRVASWCFQIVSVAGSMLLLYMTISWLYQNDRAPLILWSGWLANAIFLLPLGMWFIWRGSTNFAKLNRGLTVGLALLWAVGRAALETELLRGDQLTELAIKWWFPLLYTALVVRALNRWWTSPDVQTPEEPRDPNLPRPRIIPLTQTWWERHPRARRWFLRDVEDAPAVILNLLRDFLMVLSVVIAVGFAIYFRPQNVTELWKVPIGLIPGTLLVWATYFAFTSSAGWYLPHAGANLPLEEPIVWKSRPHWSFFWVLLFVEGLTPGPGLSRGFFRTVLGLGPVVPVSVAWIAYYAFRVVLFLNPIFPVVVLASAVYWVFWGVFFFGWYYYAITGTPEKGHMTTTRPKFRWWSVQGETKLADRKTLNTATRNQYWQGIGVVDPANILEKKGDKVPDQREQVIFWGVKVKDVPSR